MFYHLPSVFSLFILEKIEETKDFTDPGDTGCGTHRPA